MKRKKCFIGAIIGAASAIGSGIVNSVNANKARRRAQRAQDAADTMSMANALDNKYSNDEFEQDFVDRQALRCGGRRRKALNGIKDNIDENVKTSSVKGNNNQYNINNTAEIANSAINGAATLANAFINRPTAPVTSTDVQQSKPIEYTIPKYMFNTEYVDRLKQLRCGGKRSLK